MKAHGGKTTKTECCAMTNETGTTAEPRPYDRRSQARKERRTEDQNSGTHRKPAAELSTSCGGTRTRQDGGESKPGTAAAKIGLSKKMKAAERTETRPSGDLTKENQQRLGKNSKQRGPKTDGNQVRTARA
jgi:hypothetical protein